MTVQQMTIAARRVPCVDVGARQCLQVKWESGEPWELFYDEIDGFTYQPGYEWILTVEITERNRAAADESTKRYRLVDVVNRRRVEQSES